MSVLYLYALVGEPPRGDLGRGLSRERLCTLPGRGFHVVVGRLGRLVHVRGHAQMTLRVYGPRRVARARPSAPEAVAGARLGPGARYLAERRRLHGTAPELDPIRPLLAGLVADERVQRHLTPPLLASIYHLVPRNRGARYRARVARGARQLSPLRVTISGPWPPYAFGADAWP